jgi:hypothetical protein
MIGISIEEISFVRGRWMVNKDEEEGEEGEKTLTQLRRNPINQLEFLGVYNQHFRERSKFSLPVKAFTS